MIGGGLSSWALTEQGDSQSSLQLVRLVLSPVLSLLVLLVFSELVAAAFCYYRGGAGGRPP